jgi:hypothetical protein
VADKEIKLWHAPLPPRLTAPGAKNSAEVSFTQASALDYQSIGGMAFMPPTVFNNRAMLISEASQPTTERDRHLFGPGRKRILALDGGGVRGAISVAFLERLEALVAEIEGRPVLLADWFDLIGGTSTGAIIAAALALGYRASDIRTFYERLGPRVFQSSIWRVIGLRAKFNAANLQRELDDIIGTRRLETDDLKTGFCAICKRMDTGSTWIVANNPRSKFWETPADKSYIGNRHLPLANLVRASTAAPSYFDPELIPIVDGMPPGLFLDGGVTPHNNPSLHLFLMAALPQFGLNWPLGPDFLTIVSIGTGTYRPRLSSSRKGWYGPLGLAIQALSSQISEAQQLVHTLMSWLGETGTRWTINSELGDVGLTPAPFAKQLFRFQRYDVSLERDWLANELDSDISLRLIDNYRRLDAAENIPALYAFGQKAAEKQMVRGLIERL